MDALKAYRQVDFYGVASGDQIWKDVTSRSFELNGRRSDGIVEDFLDETRVRPGNPGRALTQVVVGNAGSGKTHFMSGLRRRVLEAGGWFVVFDIVGLKDFWSSAALSYITSLLQPTLDGSPQYKAVLIRIADLIAAESTRVAEVKRLVMTGADADLQNVADRILTYLFYRDERSTRLHHDVFRALILLFSSDHATSNLAYTWLQGMEPGEDERKHVGLGQVKPAVELVRGMSWIMGIAGPTMVALDQIDALVNPHGYGAEGSHADGRVLVGLLTAGLIELHDVRSRGMTLLSCIPATWKAISEKCTIPERDRFRQVVRVLAGSCTEADAEALVTERLDECMAGSGFDRPHPTWPVDPAAFKTAVGLLPRDILNRAEAHRLSCVAAGEVVELRSFERTVVPPPPPPPVTRFEELKASVDMTPWALQLADDKASWLVRLALTLLVRQQGGPGDVSYEVRGDAAVNKPPIHGRFVATYGKKGDTEDHFCFRAISAKHPASTVAQLGAAMTASVVGGPPKRRELTILRNIPFSTGPVNSKLVGQLAERGGRIVAVSEEDVRILLALRTMAKDFPGEVDSFLAGARPLDGVGFLAASGVLDVCSKRPPDGPPVAEVASGGGSATGGPAVSPDRSGGGAEGSGVRGGVAAFDPKAIPVGRTSAGDVKAIRTGDLPRHTAILAGAGSGKTVLIRRIVEEAAIRGIPAIVIDPNNDLSRLGTPWEVRPESFTDEDEALAKLYRDEVEVVVWTPGISAGRPLTLPVFPVFVEGEDQDSRDQSIAMVLETVAPLAGASSGVKLGILSDAVRRVSERGGGGLEALVELLSDLPEGVSSISVADKEAPKLADAIRASMSTNPLLRATGVETSVSDLYTAADPGKTRVSVVSLAGLTATPARQDFVNRLQMALYGWIKDHPSSTGRLYVMDEAQIFMPSMGRPASRKSATVLTSEARKYGLGVVLATQLPKAIDNGSVSNCTTHFYGKMGSTASVDAIKEMAAARGGQAADVGTMRSGFFYFSSEGSAKPVKIGTSMCLTSHGGEPPTKDEIVRMAAGAS